MDIINFKYIFFFIKRSYIKYENIKKNFLIVVFVILFRDNFSFIIFILHNNYYDEYYYKIIK